MLLLGMRAVIDTEPAPSVAPGLGAGNRLRARTAATEFIGLPAGAAPFGSFGVARSRQSILTISLTGKAAAKRLLPRQINTAIGGEEARRRLKEVHHVH
jgi:hypothetical protein